MAGERCWISILAANWSVRDPSTSLAGVMSTGRRRETLGVIITHSQCKMRAHCLGDECLDQHWNPICNECWLANFWVGDSCYGCKTPCIVSFSICNACLLFLLQFSFNFHCEFPYFTITIGGSARTPLIREDIHIMVLSKSGVRWYSTTIVPCRFENSQCHHGCFSVQSGLRLWNHGVLSVLITYYRISDIVRSSAEVKRSRLPCLAPSSLTGRPPGVGFRSSTRHVEIRRMSGEMYIVAMPRQN